MSGAAGASAAHAATIANAIKVSGTAVRVEPDEFLKVLRFQDSPLEVIADGRFLSPARKVLSSYRGLAFFCRSRDELRLPVRAEVIRAGHVSVPEL